MRQTADEQIRRLPNGAIDCDYYLKRSHRLRSVEAWRFMGLMRKGIVGLAVAAGLTNSRAARVSASHRRAGRAGAAPAAPRHAC